MTTGWSSAPNAMASRFFLRISPLSVVSCPLLRQIEEIILGSRLLSYGYKATGIRGYGQLTTDN